MSLQNVIAVGYEDSGSPRRWWNITPIQLMSVLLCEMSHQSCVRDFSTLCSDLNPCSTLKGLRCLFQCENITFPCARHAHMRNISNSMIGLESWHQLAPHQQAHLRKFSGIHQQWIRVKMHQLQLTGRVVHRAMQFWQLLMCESNTCAHVAVQRPVYSLTVSHWLSVAYLHLYRVSQGARSL